MIVHIDKMGTIECLYTESLDLPEIGKLSIRRASYIEPDGNGEWIADLSPVHGPIIGPFSKRSDALQAEIKWLNQRLTEERMF